MLILIFSVRYIDYINFTFYTSKGRGLIRERSPCT